LTEINKAQEAKKTEQDQTYYRKIFTKNAHPSIIETY